MSKILGYEIRSPWGPIATFVDVSKEPVVIGAAFSDIPKFLKSSGQKLDIVDFKKDSRLAGVSAVVIDWIAGDVDAFTVHSSGLEVASQSSWWHCHLLCGLSCESWSAAGSSSGWNCNGNKFDCADSALSSSS
jgi:hypothetical protein